MRDNIKMNLQEVRCEGMDWIEVAQDRDRGLRHQITDRQRIGYNIPQAVLHSQKLLIMGRIVVRNVSS